MIPSLFQQNRAALVERKATSQKGATEKALGHSIALELHRSLTANKRPHGHGRTHRSAIALQATAAVQRKKIIIDKIYPSW
jgi:hypothetical protein